MKILTISESLHKAYRRNPINKDDMIKFQSALRIFYNSVSNKGIESSKETYLRDFLKSTFYSNNDINKLSDNNVDWAVRLEGQNRPVGIIIEDKRQENKREMITADDLNRKAMQQLVYYYLIEKEQKKNIDVRHLIANNMYEFFIFDATSFEKYFYQNKELVREFKEFELEEKDTQKVLDFYKYIGDKYIKAIQEEIPFTHFDLRTYEKSIVKEIPSDNDLKRLTPLYRIFSNYHLLKIPFTNERFGLNTHFYAELLHIMGLEEVEETKGKKKKVIRRLPPKKTNKASLMELTIPQVKKKLYKYDNRSSYGDTEDEQLFNISLELCITWINRILFLKLLESQLLKYQKNNPEYRFLTIEKVGDFDTLNYLFFNVLACDYKKREEEDIKANFQKVPYLNSSLFEETTLEDKFCEINALMQSEKLPFCSQSVLKKAGSRYAKFENLSILEYLLAFLNAYDFSSEGNEEIKEEPKTLINASVLGLIFEKINGYKDGAVFTPEHITMYMCHDAIRKTILHKFNEAYPNWKCETEEQLYNNVSRIDIKDANNVINSVKICDPAVGSGHFLVSALNEIICAKYDLGILTDTNGRLIRKNDYKIEIDKDELIVSTIYEGELEPFNYHPLNPEEQRIQESLFNEKRTIIENCLFGVDINQNSVNICRLRLWIELLKNSYYTSESQWKHLETLPNIDINIMPGDSLLGKFSMQSSLSSILKGSKGLSIKEYKEAVKKYKSTNNKEDKYLLKKTIDDIKSQLRAGLWKKTPAYREWVKAYHELEQYNLPDLFLDDKIPETRKKKIRALQKIVDKKRAIIDETQSNTKYANAFEWRLEFPELLNDEGDFIGFDCIIGNPPYIQLQANKGKLANLYFDLNYETFFKTGDIYCLFYEKAWQIMKPNAYLSFINPNTWLQSLTFHNFRMFMTSRFEWEKISITNKVFDQTVDTHITLFRKSDQQEDCDIYREGQREFSFMHSIERRYIDHQSAFVNIEATPEETSIASMIIEECQPLSDFYKVYNGVKPFEKGKGIPPQTEQIAKEQPYVAEGAKPAEDWSPLMRGSLMNRYTNLWNEDYWIQYGPWLAAPREPKIFSANEKIIVRQTGDSIIATLLGKGVICRNNIHICIPMQNYNNKYVLGLLNSKLINFIYTYINPEKGEALAEIKKGHVEMLPIKMIDDDVEISKLVSRILVKREADYDADITVELNKIDEIVYHLYGLTYNEVLIVDSTPPFSREHYDSTKNHGS